MKKILTTLSICALALVCVFAEPSKVEAASVSDLTFALNADGKSYSVISCDSSAAGDLIIPATYDGKRVTAIGGFAFEGRYKLTSVTIPDGVVSIGASAFRGCEGLMNVTMPDSVESIGDNAFYCCWLLDNVTIGNGVKSIGDSAFEECESLRSLAIPDSVESIGDYAFSECLRLSDLTIGRGVKSIGDGAFYCCDLTSVIIPDGVENIGNHAFSCSGLTSVSIPNSVTAIGEYAFQSNSLTYTTYKNANYLGNPSNPYLYLVKATSSSVTTVKIHSKTKFIGDGAFWGCSGLTSFSIPDSVTNIGKSVLYNCNALTNLVIGDGVTDLYWIDFGAFPNLATVTIGNGVTKLEDYVFDTCRSLTSVTIGNGVQSIGECAFDHCYNLTSVTIGSGVQSIGKYAFNTCSSLTSLKIGNSVQTIGERAFIYCSALSSITFGKGLQAIGEYAFEGCDNLSSIQVDKNNSVYKSDNSGFLFGNGGSLLVFAPKNISGHYTIPDGVTHIDSIAFCGCDKLQGITVPDSVQYIGDAAFAYCSNLGDIDFGNGINGFGYRTFFYCTGLTSVLIPGSVDYLGEEMFHYCTGLTNVVIKDGVAGLGKFAVSYCTNLTSISIPDSVKDIGIGAFSGCGALETVYYSGTQGEWENITVGNYNELLSNANKLYDHLHNYSTIVRLVAPTCTAKGYTTYTCECGDTYKEDETKALGHSYTNACDTTCNRADCGAIRTITHSYAVATCTKAKTCKVCKVTSGKALGHTYKSGKCTRCSYRPAGAKITTQPVNVAVANGKNAKVTVKATGDGLKYQWYYAKKGSSKYTKDSVTSASYSVKMSSSVDGRKVYCVVTDQYGNTVKSSTVTLYKGTPVKITTQPKGITVANGKTGSLTVKASGSSLKYQWYVKYKGASSFTKVGKSNKTYSFKMASKFSGAQAYCVVKDKYGIEVKSSVITPKMPAQPKVTTQPKSVTQVSGKTVKFTVKASGDGLKYQWYYAKKGSSSFKKLSGATKATYSVKVSSSVNGRKCYCLVTDKYGQTVKSSAVTLTMKTVAKITTQPKNVTVKNGKTAKVTIKAVGDGLKYTWYYLKPGATKYVKATTTAASYSVKMAAAWKNAKVYCVIADKYGNTVKSSVVTLKMK